MQPVIDFSGKLSVSNTAYDAVSRYSYTPPAGKYLLVREVSVAGDSTFLSNGKIQMVISGNSVTSNAGTATEISPLNSFSLPFGDDDLIILGPGEKLEVNMRVTSGTGTAQALLIGMLLNEVEYRALLAKKGLV